MEDMLAKLNDFESKMDRTEEMFGKMKNEMDYNITGLTRMRQSMRDLRSGVDGLNKNMNIDYNRKEHNDLKALQIQYKIEDTIALRKDNVKKVNDDEKLALLREKAQEDKIKWRQLQGDSKDNSRISRKSSIGASSVSSKLPRLTGSRAVVPVEDRVN